MAIRLSGMVSGLDTDSVVQALMSAQKYKKTKIEASKQKLEWKQELWSEMNTKVYNFYKTTLSKMRMQSTFKTKTAASSDSSKVTATAGSSAAEGTYRIKVNSVASAQYVTSGVLGGESNAGKDVNGNKITESTKLVDLVGANFGTNTQIQFGKGSNVGALLVDDSTTIEDFVTAAKSVGINASFDASQQRFFIGSSTSGADQSFMITAVSLGTDQENAVSAWRESIGYEYLSSSDKAAVSKIFYQLQTGNKTLGDVETSLKKYLGNAEKTAVTEELKKQITESFSNYYAADKSDLTAAGKQALVDAGVKPSIADVDAMTAEDRVKAAEKLVTSTVKDVMGSTEMESAINASIQAGVRDTTVTVNGKSYTIAEKTDGFLSLTHDARTGDLLANATAYADTMNESGGITKNSSLLNSLGLDNVDGTKVDEGDKSSGMVVVEAADASITFNGATLKSSNSALTVNGLTLNILDKTDAEMTITVSKDTSAVYDTVKDFISEYNSILKGMNTSYNAASAKGYDVLTDEMKEDMTDDEIEKWETKVKSALLRRDDTLNSLIASFRNNMMSTYTASDGKQYSLATLGIMTSTDYTEKGLLHIMGDEDDDIYADSENKLQKMLGNDPDLAMEIMTGIADKLYNDLQQKMRASKYSSALTFYNDKQMKEQVSKYKKEITTWESKLADMEERYYKQFTAMEKAMANLQSQQNSLSGFFG